MQTTFPGFDPDRIASYFKMSEDFGELAKKYAEINIKAVDPKRLFEIQKRNMETLAAANRSTAQAYEHLFRKQVEVLQSATVQTRESLEKVRANSDTSADPEVHMRIVQEALESTVAQLSQLTEEAAKANAEALEAIRNGVMENAAELAKSMKG